MALVTLLMALAFSAVHLFVGRLRFCCLPGCSLSCCPRLGLVRSG